MRRVPSPAFHAVWRIAVGLGLLAVLAAGPVRAADTGNGSKNFHPPNSVPNYFSNEAGPMLGPASETQRGALYSNRTASSPATAAPAPSYAAAPPRGRQHIAMAVPRGRAVRGRRGEREVAHHVAVHGRTTYRAEARGVASGHSVHAARTTHSVGRTTRVSSSHRHARG